MPAGEIVIKGAREHNLQEVSVSIPRNQLVVLTGVSGSGKSSLAFDTLYAEGQRRYVESLSSYARQFLGQMPKPDVDAITGLAPSISIQQKASGRNPRSTVGTITEIYDYLRVLYARVGSPACHTCGRPITAQTRDQIVRSVCQLPEGTRLQVLAPLIRRQKGEYRDLFADLLKQGFLRARVDGRVVQLADDLKLDKQIKHTIDVLIDRITLTEKSHSRLAESIDLALKLGQGEVRITHEREARGAGAEAREDEQLYSCHYACTACGISYQPPSPQVFSFNSPQGMCPACQGLGIRYEFVEELLIPDPKLSLQEGAIALLGRIPSLGRERRRELQQMLQLVELVCELPAKSLAKRRWRELPEAARSLILHGAEEPIEVEFTNGRRVFTAERYIVGLTPPLVEEYHQTKSPMRRMQLEKYMREVPCSVCAGARLNPEAASYRITSSSPAFLARVQAGEVTLSTSGHPAVAPREQLPASETTADESTTANTAIAATESLSPAVATPRRKRKGTTPEPSAALTPARATPGNSVAAVALSLPEVCRLSTLAAWEFFNELVLDDVGQYIAAEVLKEIRGRLGFLLRCGLDYLTLDRTAPTLSGGESQRIRLAGQIGCGLVGVVYILDEPSIGLHPRDNTMLLDSLRDLRDQGNTVIVVEHDEETMRAADCLIDFGPGPGVRGGRLVAQGNLEVLSRATDSVTGAFLSGRRQIAIPATRRPGSGHALTITGATHHNLRGIDVAFPLGTFLCVTGVSGSGKSSLVNDILWELLNRDLNGGEGNPGAHSGYTGLEHVDKAIDIDQSPIGRTPRSNPATYTKLFDLIRDLYTELPESKVRGFKPGRFSFNVPGGRCEACEGNGANRLEMDFLADIWVTCPVCQGRRFNKETLEVRFKGKSIHDVLNMDVQQALEHFENQPKIHRILQTLRDVGLDYIKIGQPSPTLSGGEAQRIKLAKELSKRSTGKTIYILDEPTTGLHFVDIEHLLRVLHGFVEAGNTVIVVEHNLDVIKTADWVIDLGPEGGAGGGAVVVAGTPEQVAACPASHTGQALQQLFTQIGWTGEATAAPAAAKRGRSAARGAGKPRGGKASQDAASSAMVQVSAALRPAPSATASGESSKTVTAGTGATISRWQTAVALHQAPPGAERNIVVRGAAQHNLRHLDVQIPRDQLSVFCGPSGSGKTSLAMDTLYAEGQRRYVESLSSYARQFLGQMPKPKVEQIYGLQPAIAIEQKSVGHTPRSTVGTVTEIYDYLRILYARLGTPHCPTCRIPVRTQTSEEVVNQLLTYPAGTRMLLLAPQEVTVGQNYEQLWTRLTEQGYRRVRIDQETFALDAVPAIDRKRKHQVEVVIDRVTIQPEQRGRIAESVRLAFDVGMGVMRTAEVQEAKPEKKWKVTPFSLFRACEECGTSFEELAPHQFSFNSALGWCEACQGLGTETGTNLGSLVTDPSRSLWEGAIDVWPDPAQVPLFGQMLRALAAEYELPLDVPFSQLDAQQQRLVLQGQSADDDTELTIYADSGTVESPTTALTKTAAASTPPAAAKKKAAKKSRRSVNLATADSEAAPARPLFRFRYRGVYPAIELARALSHDYRREFSLLVGEVPCGVCQGSRLRPDAAAVRLRGKTLQQLCDLSLRDALAFLNGLDLSPSERKIAGDLLTEATGRLSFLVDVGLHYVTLSRTLPTLSGGETQRIRLAGQIGRALTGVLYVLDEPTIGLHPSDNHRLLGALLRLRDLGNTVVLVEHDREVIEAADQLFDFGPGSGRLGGTITAAGAPPAIEQDANSLTGKYLSGREQIVIPETRRLGPVSNVPPQPSNTKSPRPPGAGDARVALGALAEMLELVESMSPQRRSKLLESIVDGDPSVEKLREALRENPEAANRALARSLFPEFETPLTAAKAPPRPGAARAAGPELSDEDNWFVQHYQPPGQGWLTLLGARQHNLRKVDLRIPLGTLTVVTGVSGSGKSSLIDDTLARALRQQLMHATETPGPFQALHGLTHLDKVIVVDQQPLGNTPASNPATYTGVFDAIRDLFARLPEARVRGFTHSRFSFNREGGRCEACFGLGQKLIEMHFLPDVWVECDSCRGQRYNAETLAVKYRGRTIADVLAMSIGEAYALFEDIPKIRSVLAILEAIGLDYLQLGQSAPTLSGGEAQRVKLAAELSRPQTGKTLYLLDEPTTGLHFDDIRKLLKILNSLVDAGNTVVVIEHNLDVIKSADWLVDLGPQAGLEGGRIVAQGTPEDVAIAAIAYRDQQQLAPLPSEMTTRSGSASTPVTGKKKPSSRAAAAKSKVAQLAPQAGLASASATRYAPLLAQATPEFPPLEYRSLTGEILAEVLLQGTRGERESFDQRAAAKKRAGDLDLSRLGTDEKPLWQTDGKTWHTGTHPAEDGQLCRWDGEILETIIDQVANLAGLGEPNWNHRTEVTISAQDGNLPFFLCCQTSDRDTLNVAIAVQVADFSEDQIRERLGWEERPGTDPRIGLTELPMEMQLIELRVKSLDEVQAKGFKELLSDAAASYLQFVESFPAKKSRTRSTRKSVSKLPAKVPTEELQIWKVLKRRWHTLRKGFPDGERIRWSPEVLEQLLALLDRLLPTVPLNYDHADKIVYEPSGYPPIEVFTKRPEAVVLRFAAHSDAIDPRKTPPADVAEVKTDPGQAWAAVELEFRTVRPKAIAELAEFMLACWEPLGYPLSDAASTTGSAAADA